MGDDDDEGFWTSRSLRWVSGVPDQRGGRSGDLAGGRPGGLPGDVAGGGRTLCWKLPHLESHAAAPQRILDPSTSSEEDRVGSSVQRAAASEQPVPLHAADPGADPVGDSGSSSFKVDIVDRSSGELVAQEPLTVGHVAQALGDQEDCVVRVEQDKESSNEADTQAPYPPAGYFVVELSEGGPQGVRVLENVEAADVEGTHAVGLSSCSLGYLGMQLALRPLTKAEWQPFLDRIVEFIPAWQRGLIQKQGRLILVKSVISAKTTHQCLVAEAPVWLLEEAAKWMRAFLWVGKNKVNCGQCAVAWDKVCKPLAFGGLGIKDLRLQGLALRTRWEWLRRTDSSRPWYGLPMLKDSEAEGVFRSLASIKLGSGASVLFWTDHWINGATVADLAPAVVLAVGARQRNNRTVADGLLNDAWVSDISTVLAAQGVAEAVGLWLALRHIVLQPELQDSFSWPCATNNQYSAKETYMALCQGSIRSATVSCTWKPWAPLKCKFFIWLAFQYRVWTSDRRVRQGLQDEMVPCYVCLHEEDTLDHILLGCVVAREVWFRVFRLVGVQMEVPDGNENLQVWWLKARKKYKGKDRRLLDTLIMVVCWSLWKHRNAFAFNNARQQLSVVDLACKIVDEFKSWVAVRAGTGAGVKLGRE
ncbi:hypothetical protein ACQ4PT_067280 [Festuca glaucescens]